MDKNKVIGSGCCQIARSQINDLWSFLYCAKTNSEGFCHCDGGPALVFVDENKNWLADMWFYNGELHRIGGPAITNYLGHQTWAIKGNYHRSDGPAIINDHGVRYFLNGVELDVLEGFCIADTDSCSSR